MSLTREQALDYHFGARPGKIEVTPTKPCRTQRVISAWPHTPGVAVPCLEIRQNPHDAFKYTARGNLVAVVTNGTAVLGLGDIGALAGKPVMHSAAPSSASLTWTSSTSSWTRAIPTKSSRSASSWSPPSVASTL